MPFIAPAGTPLRLSDLAKLVPRYSRVEASEDLAHALAAHAERRRGWLISTGRAAMTVLLRAVKARADARRTDVVVPAYTCYSVPASVARAGLKPRLCDIDPRTLSPDLDRLQRIDPSRTLAIVSANLYGLPNALSEMEAWADRNGVIMLDDAAQALGAAYAGRPVGGFGAAGIYSFDKGKNITSLEGGAIVASDAALCEEIDRTVANLARTPVSRTLLTASKLIAYSLLLHPRAYGIVQSLPVLGLGRTIYEDSYPITRYSNTLARITRSLMERLTDLTSTRERNALALCDALRDVHEVEPIALLPSARGAYTRLPILVPPERRASILGALQSAGIGATASYPSALSDVREVIALIDPEDRDTPGAREVANRIVTLPTHPYVPANLPMRVREVLSRAL